MAKLIWPQKFDSIFKYIIFITFVKIELQYFPPQGSALEN